jgi:uncharacterized membrane protein
MNPGVANGPKLSPLVPAAVGDGVRRFDLIPRCSLTPRNARICIAVFAAGTFGVAGFFAAQGYWPILPFAGLEIALLAWAIRHSMRNAQERETITVTEDCVAVQRCTVHGEQHAVFPRHWVKVKLHAPLAALHPSRLILESHGRACEVGRFLTEDERRGLALRLKQLVGNVNESPALR